ncbi:hypothetical protein E8E12_000717 [Didymella heteroderae]|uniref:Uncharacterized protein n=1 Tax=Didymella heteroderae TaxID=1769908 RepID=A0A9P5BUH7_9PLEO|nr:hypothetical protein E8E12_000717 [Didymella heteroderae]
MTPQNASKHNVSSSVHHYDDHQLDQQLYHLQLCLNLARQRIWEKNTLIQNLQHNLSSERTAMAREISTLKRKSAHEQKTERGALDGREHHDSGAREPALGVSNVGTSQLREGFSWATQEALGIDKHQSRQQPVLELSQEGSKILASRTPADTVLPRSVASETGSDTSALVSVLSSVEIPCVPARARRKRAKRALRGDDCI